MRISRIQIYNFRNFAHLDVDISAHAVIVGENKIGKSNLVHALRLILDPSLPDTTRQLRDEDFWDGLSRPLTKEARITISLDLTDFEDNENQLAVLAEHLVNPEPMIARLTYVFQPLPTLEGDPTKEADYEFFIYGGGRPENRVGYEVRRRIPLDLLPALRDAEGDLVNWRRSPLKPLLEEVASQIDRSDMEAIAKGVTEATEAITETLEIRTLADQISARLADMVGSSHALEMVLGFSPTDPERLLRALRLFIDGGKRGIGEASLGSANLLYLALKSLELEQLVRQNNRDHTFLAIEEPEAHLHPHVQRLVYRDFLKPRAHHGKESGDQKEASEGSQTTSLLTTHSPHIVSVSPLGYLVLLRRSPENGSTQAVSTANLDLDDNDVADLERYLDVTRGEMLFAKGVLLVEGDAEVFVVPVLGKLIGVDLDEWGITVCSVAGTNFAPYVKLLGPRGLNTPFAVLTDLDPRKDGTNLGQARVLKLLSEVMDNEDFERRKVEQLLRLAPEYGFFVNDHTFEVDLFRCGRHKSMCNTLIELSESESARKRAQAWREDPPKLDVDRLLNDITTIGKGRFAQRLASRIKGKPCPTYISEAIKHVANRCR